MFLVNELIKNENDTKNENEQINKSGFRGSKIGGGGEGGRDVSKMIEALSKNTEKEISKYGFVSTSATSGNEDYQVQTEHLKYNGVLV